MLPIRFCKKENGSLHHGGLRGARVSDSFLLCIFTSGSVFKMNVCCYTTRTEGEQDSPTRGGQTSPSSLAVGPSPGTPHAGPPAPPPPTPASRRRLPQPSLQPHLVESLPTHRLLSASSSPSRVTRKLCRHPQGCEGRNRPTGKATLDTGDKSSLQKELCGSGVIIPVSAFVHGLVW